MLDGPPAKKFGADDPWQIQFLETPQLLPSSLFSVAFKFAPP
jgi:hypothetical protein